MTHIQTINTTCHNSDNAVVSYQEPQLGLRLTGTPTVMPAPALPCTIPDYALPAYACKNDVIRHPANAEIELFDVTHVDIDLFMNSADGAVLYALLVRGADGDNLALSTSLDAIVADYSDIPNNWEYGDEPEYAHIIPDALEAMRREAEAFAADPSSIVSYTPEADYSDTHTLLRVVVQHRIA